MSYSGYVGNTSCGKLLPSLPSMQNVLCVSREMYYRIGLSRGGHVLTDTIGRGEKLKIVPEERFFLSETIPPVETAL